MGIMEQTVGSHLLCEVDVLVFKAVLHHSPTLITFGITKGFHSYIMNGYGSMPHFSIPNTCGMACIG